MSIAIGFSRTLVVFLSFSFAVLLTVHRVCLSFSDVFLIIFIVAAKIRLILADKIPSQKGEGGWAGLVPAKIKQLLANDIPS